MHSGPDTTEPIYKTLQNWSKEINNDNFCYRKVGGTITKWGVIKKSPTMLSQYWKNYIF